MKLPVIAALGICSALAVTACGTASTPQPETASTTEMVSSTIVTNRSTVATAVATPFPAVTTTQGSPTPTTTPMPTATPTPSPTPGTPTATPTPAPSAALIREATSLQATLDAFQEALAAGDKDSLLKAQRDIRDELPKADAAAQDDSSKAAAAFRAGLADLRRALAGDLTKLDSAVKGIAAVSGGAVVQAGRTTTALGTANGSQTITSLPRYAKDLADQVAAFQKAQGDGSVSDLLRLQQGILDQLDRGDAALANAHSKDADNLRSALEDLRNALGGDAVKYDTAENKLLAIAGSGGTSTSTKKTTTTQLSDLQPVANELNNKLDALQHALDNGNKDEITKAQQGLSDQINKALATLGNNASPKAAQLRDALGALREAAAGDRAKLDPAKSALSVFLGS